VALSPHKFALLHVTVTGCRRLRRFRVKSSAFGLTFVRSFVKIRQPVQRLKGGHTFSQHGDFKMVSSFFLGMKMCLYELILLFSASILPELILLFWGSALYMTIGLPNLVSATVCLLPEYSQQRSQFHAVHTSTTDHFIATSCAKTNITGPRLLR